MRFKRSRLAFGFLLLTGCAGLIGVPDLTLEEDATNDGGLDSGPAPLIDARPLDAIADRGVDVPDSATCDLAKVISDPDNCGRCGHACGGGTCKDAICQPVVIDTISTGGLRYLAQDPDYLYAATYWGAGAGKEGVFRIPKAGGKAELFAGMADVIDVFVLGDTVYFGVFDQAFDDAGKNGGVWACPRSGPVPCTPKLFAMSNSPDGITGHNGTIYFKQSDYYGDDTYIRAHAADAGDVNANVVIADGEDRASYQEFMWSSGNELYAIGTLYRATDYVHLTRYRVDKPDAATLGEELSRFTSPFTVTNVPLPGGITGTATSVYWIGYDNNPATKDPVRRVPRPGVTPAETACEYGNNTELKPTGVYVDDTDLYWTNFGTDDAPYDNGSIATCPAHGTCCTDPKILWRGTGSPVAITGDAKFIYWVNFNSGEVYKLAKP